VPASETAHIFVTAANLCWQLQKTHCRSFASKQNIHAIVFTVLPSRYRINSQVCDIPIEILSALIRFASTNPKLCSSRWPLIGQMATNDTLSQK